MNHHKMLAATLPVVGALLVACGGAPAASSPHLTPCPEFPVPAPPALLYPVNGTSGAPDGNFTLVVGTFVQASPPPPVLVPANGGASVTGGAAGPAPSPMPSPAATPQPGQTVYGFRIGALQPATTYNVTFTFGPIIAGCTMPETSGQFTTQ